MRMSKLMMVPLALGLLAGCGDDAIGPADLTLADLQGTWTVTKDEFTADDDSDETYDAISADDGFTASVVVDANGQYTMTIDPKSPALPTRTQTGVFALNSTGVVDTPTGQAPVNARITIDGDKLVYTTEDATFDFPDSDLFEADRRMEWEKS
jgi:hypothetical protein